MKYYFSCMLILMTVSLWSQVEIDPSDIVLKSSNGSFIAYYKNETEQPFSGFTTDRNSNGSVTKKTYYENGVMYKNEDYYRGGNLYRITHYSEIGAEEGEYKEFDEKGNLLCKGEMKLGERTGVWYFYKEGTLYLGGAYIEGEKNGIWKIDSNLSGNRTILFYEHDVLKTINGLPYVE